MIREATAKGWRLVWLSLAQLTTSSGPYICIPETSCMLVAAYGIVTFSNHCSSLYSPPQNEDFLAHLTHSSKKRVGVIWLLAIIHDQPSGIYCLHSHIVLQDRRDSRSLGGIQGTLHNDAQPKREIPTQTFPLAGLGKHQMGPPFLWHPRAEPLSMQQGPQKSPVTSAGHGCTPRTGCMDLPEL